MRAFGYYAIAAVLFVATIPMYRYIFARTKAMAVPEPVYVLPGQSSSDLAYLASRESQHKPLMSGEICEAGFVVLVSGSTYSQALDQQGHAVACLGRYTLR